MVAKLEVIIILRIECLYFALDRPIDVLKL